MKLINYLRNYGYKKEESFNLISFDKEFIDKYRGFNKNKKTFTCMYTITFDTYNKIFYKGSNCKDDAITLQELKAINTKVKELGWEE